MPEGVAALDNLYSLPVFLGRILPAGLIGIITAGMVAAFMSTHDSYLLCWSSVLTQDVVAPLYENDQRKMSPEVAHPADASFYRADRPLRALLGDYLSWG